jgi:aldehyde dehydrogenase (NAD+)
VQARPWRRVTPRVTTGASLSSGTSDLERRMIVDGQTPPSPSTGLQQRISDIFDAQRATSLRLRKSTPAERIAKLKNLREAFLARIQVWYDAGKADLGRPPGEMDLTEIVPVVLEANQAIRKLRSWMRPRRAWPTVLLAGNSAYIRHEPRGRCLIISPWSNPLALTVGPLISAIAAGNTAILKPSESSPNMASAIAGLVGDVFTQDEVAVLEGGASTSASLLQLPFDHVFFSGSPASGAEVMAAASKHLASVTLELGGKNPAIVDESADVELAARNILWAKYTNNGQTCTAPDHVLVHDRVRNAFTRRCIEILEETYNLHDQQWAGTQHLSRIVNSRQTERLKALLDDAVTRGARIRYGGSMSVDIRFFAPTLLDQIPLEARINGEEVFGPILPIYGFSDLGDVIDRINQGPKPLAIYMYGKDKANIREVLSSTSSGGACVNHSVVQFLHGRLPFGGVNHSGMGSAHGHFGFIAFSHERAIVTSRLAMFARRFRPGEVPDSLRNSLRTLLRWI